MCIVQLKVESNGVLKYPRFTVGVGAVPYVRKLVADKFGDTVCTVRPYGFHI